MLFLSISFLLTLYLVQTSATSIAGNHCAATLSNDFGDDCDNGHLKSFAQCLHDNKRLNALVVATELNKQYCKSGECNFTCYNEGNISPTYMVVMISIHFIKPGS